MSTRYIVQWASEIYPPYIQGIFKSRQSAEKWIEAAYKDPKISNASGRFEIFEITFED